MGTYAKLTAPVQFRPDRDNATVTFRLQYSKDLANTYATFTVGGATTGGAGCTIERYVSTSNAGQFYEDYTFGQTTSALMPYTITEVFGTSPASDQGILMLSGKLTAKVEFRPHESSYVPPEESIDDNSVIWKSNTCFVDDLIMWDNDFRFTENFEPVSEYSTDCSFKGIQLWYTKRHEVGNYGSNDIQGYRIFVYDENDNLLQDSGELYDWDASMYYSPKIYTLYDLADDTTYYIKAQATLNGGYTLSTGKIPLYVKYAANPSPSDKIILSSDPFGVKVKLDLTGTAHTKIDISRAEVTTPEYMQIGTVNSTENIITITDRYAIPKKDYIYKATVYNSGSIVGTYYNYITYTNNCIKISDILGCFCAMGNITKHPISRNTRGSIVEVMDSDFPYHIMHGAPNYETGQVDALFSDIDECTIVTDNADYAHILRAWLNNGRAKLLTYYTGEAWIVSVSEVQTTDPENNDVYNTTFNWTQIGNADRVTEYVRLGLITI